MDGRVTGTHTNAADCVARVLRALRYRYTDERELQDGVGLVLEAAAIEATKEYRLSDRDRIDFLTIDGVGIEIKVARRTSAVDVTRQLGRYVKHDCVTGLVFVTDRSQLARRLPGELGGKPLSVVAVLGGIL